MKTFFETVCAAFSMFSAIPVPQTEWNDRNLRYSLCVFPLIGAVIGTVCAVFIYAADFIALPSILKGAGLCLIPVALTGGIHLDGYADTCDALACHGDPSARRTVLKDPHTGAFAAIRLCCYFVMSFALWTALPVYPALTVGLGYCLSRALSGIAVVSFPLAGDSGLACTFASAADSRTVRAVLTIFAALIVIAMALCGLSGILMAATALIVFWYFRRMSGKKFAGLSGDLNGWFLQVSELSMWAVLCLSQYIIASL